MDFFTPPLNQGRAWAPAMVAAPRRSGWGTVVRGSSTRKVAPWPGVLSTSTAPPWARAMASTMDRPRPVPPWARLRAASTR